MPKKSYFFLTFLVLILFFILGVRYGQKVEKANKVFDCRALITPTTKPSPSPTPTPIPFNEYKSKRWGIKFKYPANLEVKESTNTAEIFIEEKEATKAGGN